MNRIMQLFRKRETRHSTYTQQMIADRAITLAGTDASARLTATVQACIQLWEGGLSGADVDGTEALTPPIMGMVARSLATTGAAVLYITPDGLIPVATWSLSTRDGQPVAYRLELPDQGERRQVVALAGEVLHFRIGCSTGAPWCGTSPLSRAPLTAGILESIEGSLSELYANAPIGSTITPWPEDDAPAMERLQHSFRGKRGRVLLRDSVNVASAGGPTPASDWRPAQLTPDLSGLEHNETLAQARHGICSVYGVLPGLLAASTAGPAIREAQRHLAQWVLEPIARQIEAEASQKLGAQVRIDVTGPMHAYDAGGRARSMATIIRAMAEAKEAGLSTDDLALAFGHAGIET